MFVQNNIVSILLLFFMQLYRCTNLQSVTCKNHVFSDSGIMIAPEPGTKADPNFSLPEQTATCIGLTMTYEKVTLTRKKNTIKILAKLYESATSHSKCGSGR